MGKLRLLNLSMPKNNALIPWQSAQPTVIPKGVAQPAVIVSDYAITLRPADKRAIVNALEREDYGMAAGHLWRRSISKLRAKLAAMGMRFLGEMLNREDITESSSPETVLTDHDTIGGIPEARAAGHLRERRRLHTRDVEPGRAPRRGRQRRKNSFDSVRARQIHHGIAAKDFAALERIK